MLQGGFKPGWHYSRERGQQQRFSAIVTRM